MLVEPGEIAHLLRQRRGRHSQHCRTGGREHDGGHRRQREILPRVVRVLQARDGRATGEEGDHELLMELGVGGVDELPVEDE